MRAARTLLLATVLGFCLSAPMAQAATVTKLFKGGKAQVKVTPDELGEIRVGSTVTLEAGDASWDGIVYKIVEKYLLSISFDDRTGLKKGAKVTVVLREPDSPKVVIDDGIDVMARHPGSQTFDGSIQLAYAQDRQVDFFARFLSADMRVERSSSSVADSRYAMSQDDMAVVGTFSFLNDSLKIGPILATKSVSVDLEIEDFIDENVIKSNRNSGHLFAIYSLPMGLSIGLEYEFVKDTIDIAELEDPDTVQRETYSYTFDRLHPAIMWRGPGFDVGLVHSTKVKIISEKVTEQNGQETREIAFAETEPAETTLFGQYAFVPNQAVHLAITQVKHKEVEALEPDEPSTVKDEINWTLAYKFRPAPSWLLILMAQGVPQTTTEPWNSPSRIAYQAFMLEGHFRIGHMGELGAQFASAAGSKSFEQRFDQLGAVDGKTKLQFTEFGIHGRIFF